MVLAFGLGFLMLFVALLTGGLGFSVSMSIIMIVLELDVPGTAGTAGAISLGEGRAAC